MRIWCAFKFRQENGRLNNEPETEACAAWTLVAAGESKFAERTATLNDLLVVWR